MPFDTLHVPLHPNIYIYTHTHTHTPSHSLARTCTITDLETHVTCLLPWQPSDDGGAPPRSPFCSPAYVSPCTWVLTRLVHRSLIPTSPMVLSGIGALGTNLPRLVTRNPNPHSMEGTSHLHGPCLVIGGKDSGSVGLKWCLSIYFSQCASGVLIHS